MPTIKNMNELEEILNLSVKESLKDTQEYIFEILKQTVINFYNDYTPTEYERTYEFMKSVIKTDINFVGNSLECTVEVKREYLDYRYPNSNWYGEAVTGLQIADWAKRGIHGGKIYKNNPEKFWRSEDYLSELFIEEFKANLESHGFKVTK